MNAFDGAVLAILAASAAIGVWRGVVGEMLALAAWVAAFFAARAFGGEAAALLAKWLADPALRMAAGYGLVFVGVLVAFALVRVAMSVLVKAAGLGLLDRLLGGAFGVVRGILVVWVAVLVAGMTPLPKAEWWREAVLAPPLETAVLAARPWLPAELAKRVRFR